MEVIELALRGRNIPSADPDDEQFVQWRMPLLIESMTADRFRNRATRRPKDKKGKEIRDGHHEAG